MTQKTYAQIKKQIDALQREADELRVREVSGVVARIKEAIAHYGLTQEQLGYGAAPGGQKAKGRKAPAASGAAYSDGLGNTWGGRGPRPQWLKAALSEGRALEEFASAGRPGTSAAPKSTKKATKSAVSKRRAGKTYRDEAGNTWLGRGPRPRWLKDALAAGKKLEQLEVAGA